MMFDIVLHYSTTCIKKKGSLPMVDYGTFYEYQQRSTEHYIVMFTQGFNRVRYQQYKYGYESLWPYMMIGSGNEGR